VVAHPLCIAVTWIPCVLLGMWAAAVLPLNTDPNAVLGIMVNRFSGEILGGLIGAGILAAIMSSMDSQFLCLGSMFTNDIVVYFFGRERFTDAQRIMLGRGFVLGIVVVTFLIALNQPASVFKMGVWCFSGFAGLFPIAIGALYWKRSNKHGAIAAVLTVAVLWLVFLPQAIEGEFLIGGEGGVMPVTLLVVLSTTVMIVVTLLTPAPDREVTDKFFPASRD
jgi:SSS family solute:Na+ symporter